jgi:hypothetical protein
MSEPLGPAVTESFPAAVGLHELLTPEKRAAAPGASPSPAPAAPPAPEVPAVEFSPKLFLNALRVLDRIASRMLKVEPEESATVEELAEAIAPLVQYYGKNHSTVGALWGNLLVVLVGVSYAKYEKLEARNRAAGEPEPAPTTPALEEESDNGKGGRR